MLFTAGVLLLRGEERRESAKRGRWGGSSACWVPEQVWKGDDRNRSHSSAECAHTHMGEEAETGREWASVADKASGYSSRAASCRPCCSNPVWR